ncbi:uncharacterized protein [Fopius arisanus]|uniref:Uncharacterized protein isoform X1 n=2 Tax=Fopius arisanus TaxID=64838 RepID=A0A9R1T492_9HYME|nr:PREDICTED: uncharacterized protein LOC105266448 isoform X1 [Fopius arisanus]
MSDPGTTKYHYYLVGFKGEANAAGEMLIEIVPKSWLIMESEEDQEVQSYYPPEENYCNLQTWLKEEIPPKRRIWKTYPIEILGHTVTLDKAYKKLERLYKTRSATETTDSEAGSSQILKFSKKRATSMLKRTYSLNLLDDIREETNALPAKKARVNDSPGRDGSQIPISSTPKAHSSQSSKISPTKVKITPSSRHLQMIQLDDTFQKLREENKDDPLRMCIADYVDAVAIKLSHNWKYDLHLLQRNIQHDMGTKLNTFGKIMQAPTVGNIVTYAEKLSMRMPMETPEDFDKWERMLDFKDAENIEEVRKRREALIITDCEI